MKSAKDVILQSRNIDYISNSLGKEQWILVSGHKTMNDADAGFWCGFVDKNSIDIVFNDYSWDMSPSGSGFPGFEGGFSGYTYQRCSLEKGLEPLLFYREFYGVEDNYVEISQEFILLNNLRFDYKSKSYWAMYESGESEEAVRYINGTSLEIKPKFLYRYAAAKQLAVIFYFDIRTEYKGKLSDYGVEEFSDDYRSENLYYGFWGHDMGFPDIACSVLMGKKIVMPGPIESCGIWPFEPERKYEDYIIGADEYGNEITFTSNPNKLANYFGANPGAPMYLTPVFFKKEVLQKYLLKPELYEVREGYLECKNLWSVEIDNHHKNCVAVYLGDLGRDLPESEQRYWKSFNIVGEEPLSVEAFHKDFLNMSVESSMVDHRFKNNYQLLSKEWNKKFKWEFFLPLSAADSYNLTQIRIPIVDSQPEFDQLVLSLVKVLIDSINEKALQKEIETEQSVKGISKLEVWFQNKNLEGYQEHIQFLRDLQELRSTGTGHRKGKTYNKVSHKFGLDSDSFINVFESILNKANNFLLYMLDLTK